MVAPQNSRALHSFSFLFFLCLFFVIFFGGGGGGGGGGGVEWQLENIQYNFFLRFPKKYELVSQCTKVLSLKYNLNNLKFSHF